MSDRRKRFFIFSFLLIGSLAFFLSPKIVFALDNGGFELGNLSSWEIYRAEANIVSDQVYEGGYAVKIQNSSSDAYGIYQIVTGIQEGETYRFAGYGKITDSNVDRILLRIAWYESNNGSGSQKSINDSAQMTTIGGWEELVVEVIAPDGVASARTRVLLASKTSEVQAFAYFDSLSLSNVVSTPTPTPTSALAPTLTPTPTATLSPSSPTPTTYPAGVILSEFMPDPDDGNEWVEIQNTSSQEVVLSDWRIDDIAGGSSPKNFSATISGGSYYKVDVGSEFLNNSGDEVRLLYPDESLCDKTFYSYSNKGVSWIKADAIWCEAQDPTPGGGNSSCREISTSSPTNTPTPSKTPTPSPTPHLTPTISPTPSSSPTPTPENPEEEATGEADLTPFEEKKTDQEEGEVLGETAGEETDFLPFIFIGAGLLFLAAAGAFFRKAKLGKD